MQTAQQKFDQEVAALKSSAATATDANAKLSLQLSEAKDEIAKVCDLRLADFLMAVC